MAPPVKVVSGAASVRKRVHAAKSAGKRYIAVKDYVPCRSGEIQLYRGDIVEGMESIWYRYNNNYQQWGRGGARPLYAVSDNHRPIRAWQCIMGNHGIDHFKMADVLR